MDNNPFDTLEQECVLSTPVTGKKFEGPPYR